MSPAHARIRAPRAMEALDLQAEHHCSIREIGRRMGASPKEVTRLLARARVVLERDDGDVAHPGKMDKYLTGERCARCGLLGNHECLRASGSDRRAMEMP